MPALSSASLLNTLVTRNATPSSSPSLLAANATNATSNALQVVCAFPVSGQYGPGTRLLYYVLAAACVFARRVEWLRNACLAAALLFPAVAALHGITLAALHINGAIDMDIYGAFQLCSIGILAAPVMVRLSRTYFYDPGRNAIFLWTIVVLAGLLSLAVEFYRSSTVPCTHDDSGNPISPDGSGFIYGTTTCGLTCSVNDGPFSPIRQGSTNNIYVIPAPDRLSFGTGTLLAAACCIPAILSLISTWIKILQVNWKSRFGDPDEDECNDVPIEGTNGATIRKMKRVNSAITLFLSALGTPMVGAAVLAIIIIGERNFFSYQVNYQTEPVTSIGQWAPIVGTGLATLGSLYVLLVTDSEAMKSKASPNTPVNPYNCPNCHHTGGQDPTVNAQSGSGSSPSSGDSRSVHGDVCESPSQDMTDSPTMQEVSKGGIFMASSHSVAAPAATDIRRSSSNGGGGTSSERMHTASQAVPGQDHQAEPSRPDDMGYRLKVAKALTGFANYLGTPGHDLFDDSEFKSGKALDFPEIPAEEQRNPDLPQIREQYNQHRAADNDTHTPRRQSSRAGSVTGSVASGVGIEGSARVSRAASPQPPQSRSLSPFPSSTTPQKPRANTLPAEHTSFARQNPPSSSSSSGGPSRGRQPLRRETLAVPSPIHYSSLRNNSSTSSIDPIVTIPGGQRSPTIMIFPDPDTSSPAREND